MRKRWFISLIIGIIITSGCLGYLQFGRDMDVYGSHAMTADNYHEERLTVVVNKLYVEDQLRSVDSECVICDGIFIKATGRERKADVFIFLLAGGQ